MWYNVDFNKLSILLLPTFLRGDRMVAFVKSIAKPLIDIAYLFERKREENLYQIHHTGQKCYLRKVLNDRFDPEYRRIIIDDGYLHDPLYIYTDAEIDAQPYLARFLPLHLYSNHNIADTAVDFYVRVPTYLSYNIYEMRYIIDSYRLASKRYIILTYE